MATYVVKANDIHLRTRYKAVLKLGWPQYTAATRAEAWALVDQDHTNDHLDGFTPDELVMAELQANGKPGPWTARVAGVEAAS